ncbi:melanocortin receptor 5-like [Oculina patagonica]
MANVSVRDGNYTSEMNQTSTESWEAGVLVFLSALNIFLSITATLGNALIIVALHKESYLHPPTKLLLRCLAVTDLCAGLISQPLYAVAVVARITKTNYHDEGYIVSGFMLCGISVLTSTAISVDRLLALLLGLRYRQVVTSRRTRAVIACLFAIGVSCGSMHLWNKRIAWFAVITFGVLSLIISIFSYTKIYLTLRQHQARVQDHVHQGQPNGGGIPLNIARYKKSVSSIAWVQMALVACYVPYIIVSILRLKNMSKGGLIQVAYFGTVTLVYSNSSLNPILYCWKIRTVRRAAKDTIKQLNFCTSA